MTAEFLAALHPAPSSTQLVRFVAMRPRTEPVIRWHYDPACTALVEMMDFNARGYHVYVQVNPCKTMDSENGGTIENVAHVTALPMDIDSYKSGVTLQSVIDLWAKVGIPVSAAVASGNGGHLYLLLDRPYSVEEAGAVAKRVCFCSFGDMVHNPNRIMRLPGTTNWKTPPRPCTLLGLEPSRRYSLEQITHALDVVHAPQVDVLDERAGDVVIPPAEDLAVLFAGLPLIWQRVITTGQPPEGFTDMSELDWAVICALVERGATDAQIGEIYATTPIRAIKAGQAGGAYLERTIRRARATVTAEMRRQREVPTWVSESELYFIVEGRVKLDREKARGLIAGALNRQFHN